MSISCFLFCKHLIQIIVTLEHTGTTAPVVGAVMHSQTPLGNCGVQSPTCWRLIALPHSCIPHRNGPLKGVLTPGCPSPWIPVWVKSLSHPCFCSNAICKGLLTTPLKKTSPFVLQLPHPAWIFLHSIYQALTHIYLFIVLEVKFQKTGAHTSTQMGSYVCVRLLSPASRMESGGSW